jgi:hypothetical protein
MDALKGWNIQIDHVAIEMKYADLQSRKNGAQNEYYERIGSCRNSYEVHSLIEEISNKYNVCKDVFVSKYWKL